VAARFCAAGRSGRVPGGTGVGTGAGCGRRRTAAFKRRHLSSGAGEAGNDGYGVDGL